MRGAASAALRGARRASGAAGEGAGEGARAESALRRLVEGASRYAESEAAGAGELRWATQPYAARAAPAPPPDDAPHSATVLLFPGQGAQRVGMGEPLTRRSPAARRLYEVASETVGWDVADVCARGPPAELARRAQLCTLATSLAALEAAREERPAAVERARAAAGFSLGEIAALVWARALPLERALRLVEVREAATRAAAAARPGGMLAAWLAPDARLGDLLRAARDHAAAAGLADPVFEVATYLYPGCKVLAGDEECVSWAEREGRALGVRRAARVQVGAAFHTRLMAAVGEAVRAALPHCDLRDPAAGRTVYSVAEGRPYRDARDVARGLARHPVAPQRWERTLHALYARPRHCDMPLTLALGPAGALRASLRQVNARAFDASLAIDA